DNAGTVRRAGPGRVPAVDRSLHADQQQRALPAAAVDDRVDGQVALPDPGLQVGGDGVRGVVADDQGDHLAAGREHAVQHGGRRGGDLLADDGHVAVDEAEDVPGLADAG